MRSYKHTSVQDLINQTLISIERVGSVDDHSEQIVFTTDKGRIYKLCPNQDCCENFYIESIVGDLEDLIGTPIVKAEEVSSDDEPPMKGSEESYTWTFYKFATLKGYVDIRWYGSSNGYYSESVSFCEVTKEA